MHLGNYLPLTRGGWTARESFGGMCHFTVGIAGLFKTVVVADIFPNCYEYWIHFRENNFDLDDNDEDTYQQSLVDLQKIIYLPEPEVMPQIQTANGA